MWADHPTETELATNGDIPIMITMYNNNNFNCIIGMHCLMLSHDTDNINIDNYFIYIYIYTIIIYHVNSI